MTCPAGPAGRIGVRRTRDTRRHLRLAVPGLARPASTPRSCRSGPGSSTMPSSSPRWRSTTPSTGCRTGTPSSSGGSARRTTSVVAVKMSRYLTHIKRLRDPAEPVQRFLDHADGLGDRLGPVLVQLPPNLKADAGGAGRDAGPLPAAGAGGGRAPARELVDRRGPGRAGTHGARRCRWADRLGRPTTPLWRTADWGYLRFHEGRATPRPRYGRARCAPGRAG